MDQRPPETETGKVEHELGPPTYGERRATKRVLSTDTMMIREAIVRIVCDFHVPLDWVPTGRIGFAHLYVLFGVLVILLHLSSANEIR